MYDFKDLKVENVSSEVSFVIGLVVGFLLSLIVIRKLVRKRRVRKGWVNHVVEEGETITTLSDTTGTSWKRLIQVNKLSAPYDLAPGDTIRIPGYVEVQEEEMAEGDEPEGTPVEPAGPSPKVTVTTTVTTEEVDTRGADEPNMLLEEDSIETVDEIFEDEIPEEEIARELAKKPKAKRKPAQKKSGPKKITVKPKK